MLSSETLKTKQWNVTKVSIELRTSVTLNLLYLGDITFAYGHTLFDSNYMIEVQDRIGEETKDNLIRIFQVKHAPIAQKAVSDPNDWFSRFIPHWGNFFDANAENCVCVCVWKKLE